MLRPRKGMKEFEYLTLAPLLSTLLPLHPLEHPHEEWCRGSGEKLKFNRGAKDQCPESLSFSFSLVLV